MPVTSEQNQQKMPGGFFPFIATQFMGAFNDNAFKTVVILLVVATLPKSETDKVANYVSLGSGLFVLPFLIFASYSGWLSDRFPKKNVMVGTKFLEILIMSLAIFGFMSNNIPVLFACIFLLGLQSTFFGPAKYGILPEILTRKNLSQGNGYLEAFTFLAIVLGTAFGSVVKSVFGGNVMIGGTLLMGVALAGCITSFYIHPTRAFSPKKPFTLNPFSNVIASIRENHHRRRLAVPAIGLVYFWFLGMLIQNTLILYANAELGISEMKIGFMLTVLAMSIGIGSLLASRMSEDKVEIGLVPLGALGLSISLFFFPFVNDSYYCSLTVLAVAGLFAGFFVLPLNAMVQYESPEESRGSVLATVNFLTFVGMLAASMLLPVLRNTFGLKPSQILFLGGVMTLVVATYLCVWLEAFVLRFFFWMLTHTIYRIRVVGKENLPERGGALLVCNHVTFVDAFLISSVIQRFIRFVMLKDHYELPVVNHFCRLMHAIPISPGGGRRGIMEALGTAAGELKNGKMVCIFPEGSLTRTGNIQEFRRGFEIIAKKSGAPIIPVHLDNIWGSLFSFERGKYFWKVPRALPYPVTISFGKPLPPASSADTIKRKIMDLGSEAFPLRPSLKKDLLDGFLASAKKRWRAKAMSDTSGLEMSYGKLVTASYLLKKSLIKKLEFTQEPHPDLKRHAVGVVLPAGVAGALANITLLMMGHIPVNLNFTTSEESVDTAVRRCRIHNIITSEKFLKKVRIQLPGECVYVEDLLKGITTMQKTLAYLVFTLLPRPLLKMVTRTNAGTGDDVATVLFSSGSTGDPKGVMLTHRNIHANVEGLRQVYDINVRDSIAGILPFFHSFGFTGTLWFPLLNGFSAAYHFNPLDSRGVGKLVAKNRSTLLLATPTFASMYLRKVEPAQFRTLRFVIVGAEKLKTELAEKFEERFNVPVLEGFGATELSPVATVNIPDIRDPGVRQKGTKPGTIGQPIPGVTVRIVKENEAGGVQNPDTYAALNEEGMLWVGGPSVMKGYLDDPERTSEVLLDGWYKTGDIASMDKEGFITIHGRLSRFSKIAGEMVPHEKIEELLTESAGNYQGTGEDVRFAVTAVPDPARGEKIVVLYTGRTDIGELLGHLRGSGIPNLWIPSKGSFFQVDALPIRGSGKLDLKALMQMAGEYSATS